MNQQQIAQLGVLIIFLGVAIVIISSFIGNKDKESTNKVSVVGFIGFIPFGFGNDKKWLIVGIILTVLFMVASYLLFYKK